MQKSKLVVDFLHAFTTWLKDPKDPTEKDMLEFLSENFEMKSNGKEVVKSAKEYALRVQHFRKKYAECAINYSKNLIEYANEVVVRYSPLFKTHSGQEVHVEIIAIVTTIEGKIAHWDQVAAEVKAEKWDK